MGRAWLSGGCGGVPRAALGLLRELNAGVSRSTREQYTLTGGMGHQGLTASEMFWCPNRALLLQVTLQNEKSPLDLWHI